MCDCYHDPPEFCEIRKRKARKPHTCAECLRIIKPGERYEAVSGLWDGVFSSFKTCSDCVDLAKAHGVDCYALGALMDELPFEDEADDVAAFYARRRANYDRLQFERIFDILPPKREKVKT